MRVGREAFSHSRVFETAEGKLTRINGFDMSERLAADRTKGECLEPCDCLGAIYGCASGSGTRRFVRRKAEQGWWRNPIA